MKKIGSRASSCLLLTSVQHFRYVVDTQKMMSCQTCQFWTLQYKQKTRALEIWRQTTPHLLVHIVSRSAVASSRTATRGGAAVSPATETDKDTVRPVPPTTWMWLTECSHLPQPMPPPPPSTASAFSVTVRWVCRWTVWAAAATSARRSLRYQATNRNLIESRSSITQRFASFSFTIYFTFCRLTTLTCSRLVVSREYFVDLPISTLCLTLLYFAVHLETSFDLFLHSCAGYLPIAFVLIISVEKHSCFDHLKVKNVVPLFLHNYFVV